jgi:hypothetical protein
MHGRTWTKAQEDHNSGQPRRSRQETEAEAEAEAEEETETEAEVTLNLAACKYNDQIIDCLCSGHLLS